MAAEVSSVVRLVDRPIRGSDGRHSVVVSWQAPGTAPREAPVEVAVPIEPGVAEKVRWYLEDYGEFRADPAPAIASETERILDRLGRELFTAVFGTGDAATIWAQAGAAGLDRVRVEVDADPGDVPGLPWELLREPGTGRPLVLAASEFVRTHRQAAAAVRLPEASRTGLRVLLVICRPEGREDVPFRSVASRLVRGGVDRLPGLELDVLRPATYQRLAEVLRAARDEGRPYQVVHFDGHGAFLDVSKLAQSGGGSGVATSPLRYGINLAAPARPGRHGYLLFEDPGSESNQKFVDGPTLAGLLVETKVPVLVLNACRSAYAEARATPVENDGDVHERVRAYGSLAAEVADAGVPGVVAMRYNVYVVTAAQFVADLYTQMLAGHSLGRSATAARKALADDPTRHIAASPVALQDWVVPTVYEATPLTLLAPDDSSDAPPSRIPLAEGVIPAAPDVGFFGRDETLLALDRAFDTRRVVLLHAFAGAGKSTTAAEFARWYAATGGLAHSQAGSGTVLWTSFEHHLTLDRVLDVAGVAFAGLLEANGIHWAAITDRAKRRGLIVQVLAQMPVLWVWDNVEPIAGFPEGTRSAWTDDEQRELVGFLRELKTSTRAKVLLTSRRTEDTWLGTLPVRVALPPMPMRERLQLAHALIRHLAPDIPGGGSKVEWRELLRFTGGNPLTITVALHQAVREGVGRTADVEAFTGRLRAGLSPLEEARDAALGRDRSLAASLDYGFTHAFTDTERARLALLHLFRDTADINTLRAMGDPNIAGADTIEALRGAQRGELTELLGRAVEVGLLTDYGGGYYGIHPALPWYFTTLHSRHIGPAASPAALAAERAYTHAYAALGRYYHREVEEGRSAQVLPVLRAEEANLTHAMDLARTHQDYDTAIGCLQGLYRLYDLTGRDVEWARLVGDVEGDYIDLATDQPLPGRKDHYGVVTGYRMGIARDRRDWPTATRLHTSLTAWSRHEAAPHLNTPTNQLDPTARHLLRTLAVSEQLLGRLLLEQQDPGCLKHYQAAYDFTERIEDTALQAIAASNLGNAYLAVPGLRDLDQAQHWFERDLDLTPEHDRIGRAASHGSLANIARQRFLDARDAGVPHSELLAYLNTALAGHHHALELLPPDHHYYRATAHNQLGNINSEAGDVSQALHHYQQSLQHKEARGDTYGAGQTRYNIALLLQDAGRPGDALLYAHAALANFRAVGPGAATNAADTGALIQQLERLAQA